MKKTNPAKGGVGIAGVLLIVFVVLKLTHLITWSWWWVLSPLWVPIAIFLLLALLLLIPDVFHHRPKIGGDE